ncbi:hypothetical protein E2C01_098312 [Portunus trituberculatus]|uniref:Uncharacterized protein n=1 Tax=Portunus trituberculatus TaxID=210409 RepID=A0A5B7K7Y1_PORTR|nr:hypothetical protein [Portunus trituberculatus]
MPAAGTIRKAAAAGASVGAGFCWGCREVMEGEPDATQVGTLSFLQQRRQDLDWNSELEIELCAISFVFIISISIMIIIIITIIIVAFIIIIIIIIIITPTTSIVADYRGPSCPASAA